MLSLFLLLYLLDAMRIQEAQSAPIYLTFMKRTYLFYNERVPVSTLIIDVLHVDSTLKVLYQEACLNILDA